MGPSSIVLGAAFAAVQLVYQAYSKIRTNKARCARLVDRCQYVVDRIQRLVAAHGDEAVKERIHRLEATFATVARIIDEVGQQGVLASLLHSDANALQIEACNDALADLLALFNLENTVDIGRWQRDFEDARRRDHVDLLRLGKSLESGNAAIARELAQQGVTIAEVHRLVQHIGAGLPAESVAPEAASHVRALASPSSPAAPQQASPETPCTCENPQGRRASTLRRPSWSRVKMPPLANVLTMLSSPTRSPSRRRSAQVYGAASPNLSALLVDDPGVFRADTGLGVDKQALDPPPPYRLRVTNPGSEAGDSVAEPEECGALQGSGFANASSEAVRAPDSPVPAILTPCPPTLSAFETPEGCLVRRSTTHRKRTSSASATPTLRRKDAVIFRRKTLAAGRPSDYAVV